MKNSRNKYTTLQSQKIKYLMANLIQIKKLGIISYGLLDTNTTKKNIWWMRMVLRNKNITRTRIKLDQCCDTKIHIKPTSEKYNSLI